MSRIVTFVSGLLLALAAATALPALAAEGDLRMEPPALDRLSDESLQRGARTFVNYCLSCHSAKQMRYNRLTDIGLSEAQIRENLMFTTDKIGDTMQVTMPPQLAKGWFGAPPPDLSVEARVRGAEWLYNYFLAFYRDEKTPTGWNNLVFPNVGMPHVLWAQGGTYRLVEKAYDNDEEAQRAMMALPGLAELAPGPNHKVLVRSLELDTAGQLSPDQYRAMVADLVNYLDYMAEPARNQRIRTGIAVVLFLAVLFALAFLLKRAYWTDIH